MIIGIDLGTTFSAIAMVRDGLPVLIAHADERIMPSVVGLTAQGALVVGTPARNQYVFAPEQTIRSIKRQMGQETRVALGEQTYTPADISALILRELKRRIEAHVGQPVDRVVITVPAYFSDAARQATREAGELAGFVVERIINEPTAAALAYGLDQRAEQQLVAVYDLGGGTFDVSIIELDAGVIEVRASHGNTQLGGDDFDQRLAEYLAVGFEADHGVDPRSDIRAWARLLRAAEHAKIALSSQPFVQVREEYLVSQAGAPLHLDREISRAEFEGLIADLVEGTLESFDAALNDAGLNVEALDRIIFVGGSTRIPLVWQMVADHTGIEPETEINPDEAVALGAAIQAAIIAGEPLDTILVDVTPHSLGMEIANWEFGHLVPDCYSVIIPRNTTIPTTRSEVYSAITPDQTAIAIKIYQGEHPVASQNMLLGEFLIDHLRPEVAGQPPRVTVQFDFDINGILHVAAVDRGSGKECRISVKAAHAQLTPADIAHNRAALDALELEGGDDASAGAGPVNLEAQGLLARARRALINSQSDQTALAEAIATLEVALRHGDHDAIETNVESLIDLIYDLEDE
ncbi:MAG: Hsp70 family protein [Herpetosiphonaceae bacterium]|nr:Hsp70 family protein [Herpetosiphonaceae bacterium]